MSVAIWVAVLMAMAGEPRVAPIRTSVCEVAANPGGFDGKIVSLRAKVISGFEVFAIQAIAGKCDAMWLEYADEPRGSIQLMRDGNFEKFQQLLKAEMYPRSREIFCMGCGRYEVSATMVGRIDYAGGHQLGFGHMNAYPLQFELISVTDVTPKDLSSSYDPSQYSTEPVSFPMGYIEGRLISSGEEKYKGVWVAAIPTNAQNRKIGTNAFTDQDGRFRIKVKPGDYVVGVNVIVPASESFPFRTTYSPAASSFETGQVYRVGDGEHVKADFYLGSALALRSIPAKVEWPDGRPVAGANVWLTEAADSVGIVVNTAVSHTGNDGTFTLTGVVDTDYRVHADIYLNQKHCAADVVVRKNDQPSRVTFVLDRQGSACGN